MPHLAITLREREKEREREEGGREGGRERERERERREGRRDGGTEGERERQTEREREREGERREGGREREREEGGTEGGREGEREGERERGREGERERGIELHIRRIMLASPKFALALLLTLDVWLPSAAIEVPEGGNACKRESPDDICCGLHRFNPNAGQFCCGGVVADEPSSCTVKWPAYNIDTQVCLYGKTVGRPTNCPPSNVTYFCCGGIVANMPVNKCEIPDDEVNVDMECCGLKEYSVELYTCCGKYLIPYNDELHNPTGDECTQLPAMDPIHQECVGGAFIDYCCGYLIKPKETLPVSKLCGWTMYDPAVFVCCSGRVYPSNAYMCCDGQVQGKPIQPACCGQMAYSRLAHRCVAGTIVTRR
ncbi:hypothetical protein LSAT2_029044 [Lamellibrachia satsuma]|nr:hypothetical protein LSAT2_029044 [Lamellibrachia satsuma]